MSIAAGSLAMMARPFRFSQCPIRSEYSCAAHVTPPSRKANRRSGNRVVTPPMISERQIASWAAAKITQVVIDVVGSGTFAIPNRTRCRGRLERLPTPGSGPRAGRSRNQSHGPTCRAIRRHRRRVEAGNNAGHDDGFQAESAHRVIEFGHGLVGIEHRNDRCRGHAVRIRTEDLGTVSVHRPSADLA